MSKDKKKKIKVVKVEKPTVNIPIVVKKRDGVEEDEEETHRERPGQICDGCTKNKDTKKVGTEFLCKDCREELEEE